MAIVTLTPLSGPPGGFPGLDLLIHAGLFAVTTWLVLRASSADRPRAALVPVVIGVLLLAGLDELAQRGVPGRTGSWLDLSADAGGIALAAACWKLRVKAATSL